MKLSTRARYALRMMVQISRDSSEDNPVSMTAIARETDISKSYLEQLAIPLKAAGLLVGRAGRAGGYTLARDATDIRVREVVEAAIGPINLVECVGEPDLCERSAECETRLIWALLSSRVRTMLDDYTLAHLSDPEYLGQVRELLGPSLLMPRRKKARRRRETCPPKSSRRSPASKA